MDFFGGLTTMIHHFVCELSGHNSRWLCIREALMSLAIFMAFDIHEEEFYEIMEIEQTSHN